QIGTTLKDLVIAAAEGVWAYHTIQENHSFRSNDCASKLIQSCFDSKFTCARTKSEAVVVNVLTPIAMKELKDDLDKSNCITILNDASNHGNNKIYPILVRFFQPYVGVQVKILDLQDQPGETSDIIVDYLNQGLKDNNLTAKVVAFCGDNANVNFGGAARRGTNNVLTKLQSSLKKPLIGIGCGSHVIHNAIQSAADRLPLDYESIIVKIYSFFYIYTIRVEALKEFCAETETEYQQMLVYSKTRWLALMPALERILKMYQPLKNYFLSIEKCPLLLKNFFEDPTSELWLYFFFAQSASFHQPVLKLEGQTVSAIEAAKEINQLKDNLTQKQTNQFLPFMVRQLIVKSKDNVTDIDEEFVKRATTEFYQTSREYLEQWTCFLTKEMEIFYWADLKKVPAWEDVYKSLDVLIEKEFIGRYKDAAVFGEFSLICFAGTQLLFSNQKDIRLIDAEPQRRNSSRILIKDLEDVNFVDFYFEEQLIFWADVALEEIRCMHMNDPKNNKSIITTGLISPDGLAVDWMGKKLYFSDSETNRIEVSNLDGTYRKVLFWRDFDQPRSIALVLTDG
ncbi:unnamed protein product, partial [Larinioides sclopetarius]